MKYFDGLVVGDEVYSTSDEWGVVTEVGDTSVEVCFDNKKMKRFSLNGRTEGNPCQVLFYGVPDPWSAELPKRKDHKKSSSGSCSHIDRLLEKYDEKLRITEKYLLDKDYSIEKALYHLLERFKDDLPPVNSYFHKAFRQTDVIDVKDGEGEIDIAIHNLLSVSNIFWKCYEETIKELGEEK